eukprot:CAMPEP_0176288416 /NCGR_PEP_ID=MMETSP0121_2-20121125/53960_1 /TAXON_ID=160619 /ORGANISM="Kryptoperidinium foliaceum, Strain CCMP 1326" /LENGTH=69 /DNA_ID=CAMNT_0017629103 /DNA_START=52 /DNA_END=261 /DNA_ORIENTATION=-
MKGLGPRAPPPPVSEWELTRGLLPEEPPPAICNALANNSAACACCDELSPEKLGMAAPSAAEAALRRGA